MRIVVMSDSHRSAASVRKIVEKHEHDADLFLHLGDGERDFEDIMDLYPDLHGLHVCGNCDFYSAAPGYDLVKIGGKRIFFTHGHIYNVKFGIDELLHAARGLGADIVLYGHTHVPHNEYIDGLYLVNPGSCSGMNGGATYAVIDITRAGVVPILVKL
ncbi:YfcE family phosphodiesterase [Clostridiaceae bacterium NSJ-31]|uniref:Phosphoesterase n=1 Tax=Ligaoa zhengdingensis TaxID=2763658 RepID=A0A926DYN4_9FIRM|nr:YfcE family phosphodiesterase [Ligaoa zhengdingensis]MBC8545625.1 YfcE family phosphodiesterase [Ligaoa zhengdingensis]